MEKPVVFLALFVFVATICSAQVALEKSQNGEYRAKVNVEIPRKWDKSDIVADSLAMKWADRFPEAIDNPMVTISVKKTERCLKNKVLLKRLVTTKEFVEVCEEFIIYSDTNKKISHIQTIAVKPRSDLARIIMVIVFWTFAVFLIIWLIFNNKMNEDFVLLALVMIVVDVFLFILLLV